MVLISFLLILSEVSTKPVTRKKLKPIIFLKRTHHLALHSESKTRYRAVCRGSTRAYRVQYSVLAFLDDFHQHDDGADNQHDGRDRDHHDAGDHGGRAAAVERLPRSLVRDGDRGRCGRRSSHGRGRRVDSRRVVADRRPLVRLTVMRRRLLLQCGLLLLLSLRLLHDAVHLVQASAQQHHAHRAPCDHLRHHDQVLGHRVAVDPHHARWPCDAVSVQTSSIVQLSSRGDRARIQSHYT